MLSSSRDEALFLWWANGMLKSFADEHEAILYVDYFSAMVNASNGLKQTLGYDGVHPNEAGYKIMEPILDWRPLFWSLAITYELLNKM
jgi:hypothetical protein